MLISLVKMFFFSDKEKRWDIYILLLAKYGNSKHVVFHQMLLNIRTLMSTTVDILCFYYDLYNPW